MKNLLLVSLALVIGGPRVLAETLAGFRLSESQHALRQVDFEPALFTDAHGIPRIDWEKFKESSSRIVTRQRRAIVLENPWIRLTLLPEMGRVYSFVSKLTGHEQFWTNAVAKPIGGNNDAGWWLVLGGAEYTIPRGEHGTTWALPWEVAIEEDSARRKAVRMEVTEPLTRVRQTLTISIRPDAVFYEAEIKLHNTGREAARVSHWVNPMWAPGGQGELTPNTELIVPCSAMRVLERPFNNWMLGARVQDYRQNPLRWVKHWRSIGDLLAEGLTDGFFGAFSHDAGEGIVRVFDPSVTPGMDIWTWGFPPSEAHQRQYSLEPNLGYVEMWGGTALDFSDEARPSLEAGQTVTWKEHMYPFHGTGGLTFANADVCGVFRALDRSIELGLFATHPIEGAELRLKTARAELRQTLRLSPEGPLRTSWSLEGEGLMTAPRLEIWQEDKLILRTAAEPSLPLRWGDPYLDRPARP